MTQKKSSEAAVRGRDIRANVSVYASVVAAALCMLMSAGCASKTVNMNFGDNVPDTPHCEFMKDACKEAMAFQQKFEVMSSAEKQDAKVIMNAYVQQCQDAQELCRRSAGQ